MQCHVSVALLNGYNVFCYSATLRRKILVFPPGILASPGEHILGISPYTKLIFEQREALDSQGLATATLTDKYMQEHLDIFKYITYCKIYVFWCSLKCYLAQNVHGSINPRHESSNLDRDPYGTYYILT